MVTAATALAHSLNIATIRLASRLVTKMLLLSLVQRALRMPGVHLPSP